MVELYMKLKNNSIREHLSTSNGKFFITKKDFVKVDDANKDIQLFLYNRNDILIKELNEKIQDNYKTNNKEIFIENKLTNKKKKKK